MESFPNLSKVLILASSVAEGRGWSTKKKHTSSKLRHAKTTQHNPAARAWNKWKNKIGVANYCPKAMSAVFFSTRQDFVMLFEWLLICQGRVCRQVIASSGWQEGCCVLSVFIHWQDSWRWHQMG